MRVLGSVCSDFRNQCKKPPNLITLPPCTSGLNAHFPPFCFAYGGRERERERGGGGGRSLLYIANLQFAFLLFAFACIIIHQYQWRSKVRSLRRRRRAVNPFLMKASYNIRAPSLSQLSAWKREMSERHLRSYNSYNATS